MTGVVPENEIKVGMRVTVMNPTDEHCNRDITWGTGKVTYTAERTEVIFDNGSGGMFPNRCIYYEVK